MKALKSHLFMSALWCGLVFSSILAAQNDWRCVFNPSFCGGPTEPPERTELCDADVPDLFVMLYGPPPLKPGCLSVPEKVAYYTEVQTFVPDSEATFGESEASNLFQEYGFGPGVKFKKRWGSYERDLIGFPVPEWGKPIVVFGLADTYPAPYISAGQVRAIAAGACVAKLIAQVPAAYKKRNAENCSR